MTLQTNLDFEVPEYTNWICLNCKYEELLTRALAACPQCNEDKRFLTEKITNERLIIILLARIADRLDAMAGL